MVLVAVIETLTGRIGLTVRVIGLEVAGLPVVQFSLDVSKTVMTSPLVGM